MENKIASKICGDEESLTCDHCDSNQVNTLSQLFLAMFWKAYQIKYASPTMPLENICLLKKALIEALGINTKFSSVTMAQISSKLDAYVKTYRNAYVLSSPPAVAPMPPPPNSPQSAWLDLMLFLKKI